jgi:hypothetical protein
MAAAEKAGEADILFSQLSGNVEGRISPGESLMFAFYSPRKVSFFGLPLSRGFSVLIGQKCNLKIYKALRPLSGIGNREVRVRSNSSAASSNDKMLSQLKEISYETIGGHGGISVGLQFVPNFPDGARQSAERRHEQDEPHLSRVGRCGPQ